MTAPLLVRDVMSGAPITVDPETLMLEARQRMLEARIRHLVVTDDSRVVGIMTDRDVRLNLPSPATSLSVWEFNVLLARLTVREVMTSSVLVVGPDRSAAEAAQIMLDHKIGALPVVDGGRLVGIVSESDFVRAGAGVPRRQMPSILLVEDEPDLAATCERLLSRRGWRVLMVGTRGGGLAALAGPIRPALAIIDRRLPDGDGFDVLRAARAAGTPVIVVTGHGSPGVRQAALEEGAAAFLTKPFSARDLVDLVHSIAGDPERPLS